MMNIFRYLSPTHIPGPVSNQNAAAIQKEMLLQYIFYFLLTAALGALSWMLLQHSSPTNSSDLVIYGVTLLVLTVVALLRTLPYTIRGGILITALFVAGVSALINSGLNGYGIPLLVLTTLLVNALFSLPISIPVVIACLLSIAYTGQGMLSGRIALPGFNLALNSSTQNAWLTFGAIFFITAGVALLSNWVSARAVARALDTQKRLNRQIEEERRLLESRVADGTDHARKRLSQFEIASQIARDISSETNLLPLLQNAAQLIRDRFGYYHAGIFLNDDNNEFAVLRAATGEAGQAMLKNNHRLRISQVGIVGHVAGNGEARIAENVAGDSVHYNNPLLPETRSEIALPLIHSGKTIGVLDVQSVNENAFSQEDIQLLQIVADQLAVAVIKARLMQQLQHHLEELEADQRETTRQTWQTHLRNARRKFAYQYRGKQLEIGAFETPQASEALSTGRVVLNTAQNPQMNQDKPTTTLAVPVKIRNQVLGVVDIEFESALVSPDLVALIENTVDRLAISLENARLLEEIQSRAERERLVSEIATKVRASSEVENILRITAQELGRTLGVAEVMVQLRQPGE